ncbi:hypothetical protein [Bacillus sp. FJAT-45350]|uniref:hypothetical protein n=1 Tax=Bacillus sp. FJAT-45350 TaxID=2011014 RepID=UPI000BB9892F|nr:hypothetical protein [Bacillus sp. FJAT-45350]
MPITTFTEDEVKMIVSEITKQLFPLLLHELQEKQLPPLMTRQQFMELVDIGPTKCNELFNRADFPVIRELGHPRVPTKKFFEWVNKNTDGISLKHPYRVIG